MNKAEVNDLRRKAGGGGKEEGRKQLPYIDVILVPVIRTHYKKFSRASIAPEPQSGHFGVTSKTGTALDVTA